ncbi:hypothetical protein PILCRDRAFT_817771 [Piloderma croceum F 1598]|uniref:Uncharacterized protein n=1 Tax=Piloderma croceum (strain F 1598) TaxID=765440 RepID=A0A0C3BF55_PILCF|nr:hypothetical protein PILCRDRAFT_817771 [Piloderma croceum F 1598]
MSLEQQMLYDRASRIHKLLLSGLPDGYIVTLIGNIVRDSVAIVQGAIKTNRTVHVPPILLSASAEFGRAYGPAGNGLVRLPSISEGDQRVRTSDWYQPRVYSQNLGNHNIAQRISTAKPLPAHTPAPILHRIPCDRCQRLKKTCKITSHVSCDACHDDRQSCTTGKQALESGTISHHRSDTDRPDCRLNALIDQLTDIAAQVENFAGVLKEYSTTRIKLE